MQASEGGKPCQGDLEDASGGCNGCVEAKTDFRGRTLFWGVEGATLGAP